MGEHCEDSEMESMSVSNNLEYIARWTRENCKSVCLKINRTAHPEAVKKLESVPSMCGYILDLIEKDVSKKS